MMFVAGEASGDHHAAALIRALKPAKAFSCFGLGGPEMAAAGLRLDLDLSSRAVIGFVEVLKHFNFFRKAFALAVDLMEKEKPDLLVLVDYPGFNLRLAEKAKALGIRICYYISPQVWAWKASRVPKMAALLDKMLVTFPFEKPIYDAAGLDCAFVGNPLLDLVKPKGKPLKKKTGEKLVGLLPGSREQEVKALLPVMLESFHRMRKAQPGLRSVIIKAPGLPKELYAGAGVQVFEGKSPAEAYAARAACDVALVASGTATLETALLKVPFAILYKVHPLTYFVGKHLVKIHSIGLANVVAGRRIVPEFLQNLDPAPIAAQALDLLGEAGRRQIRELAPSLKTLGSPGVAARAAAELRAML